MKIGIMLRAYDRPGGIGIYSRNIVKYLLQIDKKNQYVLIYNSKEHIGLYSNYDNVSEIYIPKNNPFIWDQYYIPKLIKQLNIDIVFNTKFTVPLFTKAKKVMALHGASWFVHPEIYKIYDVFYVKIMMKIYCKRADFLIANSELTLKDHFEILNVPKLKMRKVYFAAGSEFRIIFDKKILKEIKEKYNLPDKFILTVTSYDPVKNFRVILDVLQQCLKQSDIHLVVAGKNCEKYADDYKIKGKMLNDYVHFTGWVDQKELPAFYNLASVYLFPSIFETFAIPILESMACGCPVVASNTGAIPEVAGNAAILVNPNDVNEISEQILRVIINPKVAEEYKRKGLEHTIKFSWEKTAFQTLEILEMVNHSAN